MLNKKQIVFIEPNPTALTYRLARSLKLTERYETVLVSFSKIDRKFFGKAYDTILNLELSHKFKLKNLKDLWKKIANKDIRNFFERINKMKPYIFQITGPDLFSLMALSFLQKNLSPKIYYSNDLWGADKRNFFLTREFWGRGELQKFCERRCFKKVDGILSKMSLKDFEFLKYDVIIPKLALFPSNLDEWTFAPKKKKNKTIHVVYGGSPNAVGGEKISFMEVIKIVTSQEIYIHTYGPCLRESDTQKFLKESKKNKYYINHEKVTPYKLNAELSEYNYGIFPEFLEQSKADLNPTLIKTQLCAKIINYIEAGLPIIVNKQFEYMTGIIEKYGIGFGIDSEDLKHLRKILEKKDYPKLQKNIKKFQETFNWKNKLKDIEKFYEQIVRKKI
jgi:glycosyltransferase involved in cell wall biosynthesis